jgi:lipopolysaccharide transport system permease protein
MLDSANHSTSRHWGWTVWRNRDLAWQLAWREFASKYKGSALGIAWALLTPLLMLVVYTLVFGVAMQSRWNPKSNDQLEFARILFAGIITHSFFADCLVRSPVSILANPGFVKKVVFPLEVLPAATALAALLQYGVSFLALLVVCAATAAPLHASALLAPLALLPLCLFNLGMAALLAALGVFLRDLAQASGMLVTLTLFLSPVFYPTDRLPHWLQTVVSINPVTFPITALRGLMFDGTLPDGRAWLLNLLAGALMLQGGFWTFQKTRRGFADVL